MQKATEFDLFATTITISNNIAKICIRQVNKSQWVAYYLYEFNTYETD